MAAKNNAEATAIFGEAEDQSALQAFASGLLQHSPVALTGMFAFALLELVFCCLFLTPAAIAKLPPHYVMENADDDYARVTVLAQRLRQLEDPTELGVVYLGPSTAHHALFDSWDPTPIEVALSSSLKQPIHFWSLYAAGQTTEESLLLSEQIPEGFRGVVVFVVDDDKDDDRSRRIAAERKQPMGHRFAVDSTSPIPNRDAPATAMPIRTGIYFLDHLPFFAARRQQVASLRTWPTPPRGGNIAQGPPAATSEQHMWLRYLANPSPFMRQQGPILRQIFSELRRRHVPLIVLEAPADPEFQIKKGSARAVYQGKMLALANEYGAEYWDLNREAAIEARDFGDPMHLGASTARLRFQSVFLRHLLPKLASLSSMTAEPPTSD